QTTARGAGGRAHRHVDNVAHAEAGEDPLLDPGVHPPAGGGGGVGLGGADLSPVERRLEAIAELAVRRPVRGGRLAVEPLHFLRETGEVLRRQAGSPLPSPPPGSRGSARARAEPARSCARSPASGRPPAGGTPVRSAPSAPSPP